MNKLSELRESVIARVRKIATGGVVALVLGGLLATGITVSASAAVQDALFELTITSGGEPVTNAEVELLSPADGGYRVRAGGITDEDGFVDITKSYGDDYDPKLDSGVGYAVRVIPSNSYDQAPVTYAGGYLAGLTGSVTDEFDPLQPVVLSAGPNELDVELTAGAVATGSVVGVDDEPFLHSARATAFRKSINLETGAVTWDYEGGAAVDQDGNYSISGLRAGEYVTNFTQSGAEEGSESYARSVFNLGLASLTEATPVAITRAAAGVINGKFVQAAGSITGTISVPSGYELVDEWDYPAVGVFVFPTAADGTMDSTSTSSLYGDVLADGSFSVDGLVPGSYFLYINSRIEGVSGEWYNNSATSATAQPVATGTGTSPIELGTGFDLTVTVKTGSTPLKDARVTVKAVGGINNYFDDDFTTPASGKIVIPNLPAGSYEVYVEMSIDGVWTTRYATLDGAGSSTSTLITAVDDTIAAGLTFPAPTYTTVTVVDPTGKPVVNAWVDAIAVSDGIENDDVPNLSGGNGYTNKSGVVSLRTQPDTEYTLVAEGTFPTSYNQYLGGIVEYTEGAFADVKTFNSSESANVTFALAAGGKITGVVKSTAAKPIVGADVEVFEFNGSDWVGTGYARTGTTGAYSVSVKPGSYKVGFSTTRTNTPNFLADYEYGVTDITSLATVYVGKNAVATVNKTLAPGGTLTGTVANAAGVVLSGANVTPILIEGDTRTPLFGHSSGTVKGVFSLVGLPTGTYALSVESNLVANPYSSTAPVTLYTVTAGKITKIASKILLPAASTQITGTVSGNLAPAVSGADGIIWFQSTDYLHYGSAEFTGNGAFSVTLVPGDYTYSGVVMSGSGSAYRPLNGTITVVEGQNDLNPAVFLLDPLTFITAPTIESSTWTVGSTLNAVASWDHGRAGASYQWLRDGLPIFGARSEDYVLKGGDLGSNISVRITLQNAEYPGSSGYQAVVGTSAAHAVEAAVAIELGEFELFATRTSPGGVATVAGFIPDGWTPTYTWKRNGVVIPNQTASTYTFVVGDVDQNISVEITATRLGYTGTAAVATNSLTGTLGAAATNVKKPTVTAKALAGGVFTYTATPGTWSIAGTTPVYAWYIDGQQIDSLGAALTVPADVPKAAAVAVRVSATKAGLEASDPVEVIARKGTAYPEGSPTVVFDQHTEDPIGAEVVVGQQLIAYTQTSYPFGAPTYSYVWQRQTGTAWAAIAKATNPGYTVTTADLNKNLRVLVTVSSPYYASKVFTAAAGKGVLDQALIWDRADSVSFTGTSAVSSTVTAVISAQHGDGFAITGAAVAYQWGTVSGDTFTPVAKATAAKFVVPANLVGKDLAVRVTTTKAGYAPSVETSPRDVVTTGTITVLTPVSYTGVVSDAIRVGAKLTVKPAITDVTGTARSYQWQTSLDGENFTSIAGATATTYLPTVANLGYQIRVVETITKAAHATVVSTLGQNGGEGSDGVWTVENGNPTVKVAPKVTATATAYTVVPGSVLPAGGTFSYTWLVGGELVDVSTATLPRLPAYAGKVIKVIVTYETPGYFPSYATLFPQKGAAPTASSPAPISSARVGEMTVLTGFPFEMPAGSDPLPPTFQWFASNVAIKGATSYQFMPTAAQLGNPLTLKVTFASPSFPATTFTSQAQVVTIGAGAENGISAPSGLYAVGSALTASVDDVRAGYTVGYAWYRTVGESAPVAIPKATTNKYTTLATDAGSYISLKVTYTRAGYETKSYTVGGAAVLPASGLEYLVKPTLTGTGAVDSTLTVTPGTWTIAPTLSYQWYRNDIEIPGVVGTTYKPLADHLGDTITVVVTAKRAGFFTAFVGTNDIKVSNGAAPTIVGTAVPKVTGTAKTCSTFTATTGTWNVDGLAYSYQWYLTTGTAVEAISGATASTYTSAASDLGSKVSVKVTVTRDGYLVGSRDSLATAVLTAGVGCGTP